MEKSKYRKYSQDGEDGKDLLCFFGLKGIIRTLREQKIQTGRVVRARILNIFMSFIMELIDYISNNRKCVQQAYEKY